MSQISKTGPAAVDNHIAALPHDRDESADAPAEDAQHDANRAPMRQAHADVEAGLVDTERRGTPNDVPSSTKSTKR
jgi:hypothetical protein